MNQYFSDNKEFSRKLKIQESIPNLIIFSSLDNANFLFSPKKKSKMQENTGILIGLHHPAADVHTTWGAGSQVELETFIITSRSNQPHS